MELRVREQTLAELATTVPGAVGVLRRHRLDFCCNGARGLVEACAAKGLDMGPIADEIEALARRAEPAQFEGLAALSAAQLADFVVGTYHEPLRAMLEDLLALAQRVERRHADHPACPRGLAGRLHVGAVELRSHMDKEERILFPAIRRGLGVELAGPVAVMRAEHDEHASFLEELRLLTGDHEPPPGACNSWLALYLGLADLEKQLQDHVLVENHLLFPAVLAGERS
ncbi:MAG: DUF542 domain-containing protein [Sandaracinaceae bacterium]|nr:DUF542 domain-containing protein [Sandaracinaceae bacterium]